MTGQDDDQEAPGPLERRLWRVEQRQADVLRRLDRIEANLAEMQDRQNERRYRVEMLELKLDALTKRPEESSMFGDSAVVKLVVYGLMALVAALVSGQALNWTGLFK